MRAVVELDNFVPFGPDTTLCNLCTIATEGENKEWVYLISGESKSETSLIDIIERLDSFPAENSRHSTKTPAP